MLSQVWNDPAGPIHWGANQPGMQANGELVGRNKRVAKGLWKLGGRLMCCVAWALMKVGSHKQVANRLLEPWQYINVVLSSTEFENWTELRNHKDAQPEIQELAQKMALAMSWSTPKFLNVTEWHLPYISDDEGAFFDVSTLVKLSTARCARVSYLTHGDTKVDIAKDISLYGRLVASKPWHASPLEHQATPADPDDQEDYSGNFHSSWVQYRKLFENDISTGM